MATNRTAKSGLAKDAQMKVNDTKKFFFNFIKLSLTTLFDFIIHNWPHFYSDCIILFIYVVRDNDFRWSVFLYFHLFAPVCNPYFAINFKWSFQLLKFVENWFISYLEPYYFNDIYVLCVYNWRYSISL